MSTEHNVTEMEVRRLHSVSWHPQHCSICLSSSHSTCLTIKFFFKWIPSLNNRWCLLTVIVKLLLPLIYDYYCCTVLLYNRAVLLLMVEGCCKKFSWRQGTLHNMPAGVGNHSVQKKSLQTPFHRDTYAEGCWGSLEEVEGLSCRRIRWVQMEATTVNMGEKAQQPTNSSEGYSLYSSVLPTSLLWPG